MLAVVVGSAVLRLQQCVSAPANTGDVARHLLYGLVVLERGPAWAAVPLAAIDPTYAGVSWAALPYNYPVLALLFFTGIAAVWPTVLAAKVALTLVEALNAVLVARLGGSRWLGVLYWAYPASIWWVSREAQFEPLQNLFALLALLALRRSPVAAAALLGLAVQTKVTAGLLLPIVLVRAARGGARALLRSGVALGASFLPTLVSLAFYPSVTQLLRFSAPLRYNPYYWNPLDRGVFLWNPPWLILVDAAASWLILLVLVWAAARARSGRLGYVAPIAFVLLLKVHANVQFWYWLTLPVFLLAIPDRRWLRALLLLLPLADVYSAAQLLCGPFGYTVGDYWGPARGAIASPAGPAR